MLETSKAVPDDMDAVMHFYTCMIDEMRGTDFDILWKHDVHPSRAFLRESVEKGCLYAAASCVLCVAAAFLGEIASSALSS